MEEARFQRDGADLGPRDHADGGVRGIREIGEGLYGRDALDLAFFLLKRSVLYCAYICSRLPGAQV